MTARRPKPVWAITCAVVGVAFAVLAYRLGNWLVAIGAGIWIGYCFPTALGTHRLRVQSWERNRERSYGLFLEADDAPNHADYAIGKRIDEARALANRDQADSGE